MCDKLKILSHCRESNSQFFFCTFLSSSFHHHLFLLYYLCYHIFGQGFPGSSPGKASVCNAGNLGFIPGLGRSPGEGNGSPLQYSCLENPMDRRKWQSTPVFLPGKSHGQRSLVCYSPWGHKELDMTEQLHFHFHFLEKGKGSLAVTFSLLCR